MNRTEAKWKKLLTPAQYKVLRERGTEAPFSGDLLYNDKTGTYSCAGCGAQLFDSNHKFDGHCGWPSFYDVLRTDAVHLVQDTSHGMQRVEVRCAECDGHLGHVFNDVPEMPTGMRFCINSVALTFTSKVAKR